MFLCIRNSRQQERARRIPRRGSVESLATAAAVGKLAARDMNETVESTDRKAKDYFLFGLVFWGYALIWVLTPFEAVGRTPAAQAADWLKGVFSKPVAPAPEGPGSPPQA